MGISLNEWRKSDMLWTLVSAGLSMSLSIISPNMSDVDRAIAEIDNCMKHYVKNIQRMEPIIDEDPMEDRPDRRKTNR
jgi:hypothetical protein